MPAAPSCTWSAACIRRMPFGWYVDLIRRLHRAFPRLHLKAFTAVEIAWFARIARRPLPAILEELMADGLGSLPGGGAEIFAADRAPADLPGQGGRRDLAGRPPHRPPAWPAHQRHHALRPRRDGRPIASTTSCNCGSSRTRPAASRPSSRWPSIPQNTRLAAPARRRPAWTTSAPSP